MIRSYRNAALPKALLAAAVLLAAAGCAISPTKPDPVPELRPGILQGYLSQAELPDSLALIPPPPAAGSAALALDMEAMQQSLALRETPRWDVAIQDADLTFPNAAETFSCALQAPVTAEETPYLYQLLRRTLTDAGLSTYKAKFHYQRLRPFLVNKAPTCTPEDEAKLATNYSYPSGHTALGWAWALILSEIAPDHANAILARGLAYGDSRMVCNVHWQSDVAAGRLMGAATVARLHADPGFRSDLKAAKAEIARARAKNLTPARDCSAEADALAYGKD